MEKATTDWPIKSRTKTETGRQWATCSKEAFLKQVQAHVMHQNNNEKLSSSCSKCGYTRHEPGFNCPVCRWQCRNLRRYGHLTSKCLNKEVEANFHLIDAQEIHKPKTINTSHCASQSLIEDYLSDSDNEEPFFYLSSSRSIRKCKLQCHQEEAIEICLSLPRLTRRD